MDDFTERKAPTRLTYWPGNIKISFPTIKGFVDKYGWVDSELARENMVRKERRHRNGK